MSDPKKHRADDLQREINELHAQIQKLISERNAFGLAIDRALSGIVPDEHPLRSRLVEIAEMRAEIDEIKRVEFPRRVQKVADIWRGKVEALRSEIEAMRKQEPAYWGPKQAIENRWDSIAVSRMQARAEDVPLYLALGAQTAPSVPAPIEGAKYMSNDWYYAEGWNDCRHAMLDAQPAPRVPDGWIDPNDKTQTRYLPHIGEPVLFSNMGRVYYGKHTGGSFTAGVGVCARHFVTWDCMWRPIPAAPAAPTPQENNDGRN